MRSLELFSGKGTISELLKCAGFNTTTIDNRSRHGVCVPTFCCDIRHFDYSLISPGHYNVIWASPVCTAFSLASGNLYFKDGAFLPCAQQFIDLLDTTVQMIEYLQPDIWFIENPRGRIVECDSYKKLMRKPNVYLHLLTYSSYGQYPVKPTYLLTNSKFVPRACNKFGRGNTSSVKMNDSTYVQRCSVPMELAADVAVFCKEQLSVEQSRSLVK